MKMTREKCAKLILEHNRQTGFQCSSMFFNFAGDVDDGCAQADFNCGCVKPGTQCGRTLGQSGYSRTPNPLTSINTITVNGTDTFTLGAIGQDTCPAKSFGVKGFDACCSACEQAAGQLKVKYADLSGS